MSEENPNRYEQKQIDRKERLENAADRAQGEANARFKAEHAIIDNIPLGQPVLIGHHSEKRHRGDLKRADSHRRKAFEASDKAKELRSMAKSVGTGGISSDDPDAIQKLEAELEGCRKWGEIVKQWNARVAKIAKARAKNLGRELTQTDHQLVVEDLHRLGFEGDIMPEPIYKGLKSVAFAFPWLPKLGTDATNARRIEKRIEELKKRDADPERETIEGSLIVAGDPTTLNTEHAISFKLEDNKHANRVQIWFGGKPSEELRDKLKSHGFKWAPSGGVWQRMRSNGAWHTAKLVLGVS